MKKTNNPVFCLAVIILLLGNVCCGVTINCSNANLIVTDKGWKVSYPVPSVPKSDPHYQEMSQKAEWAFKILLQNKSEAAIKNVDVVYRLMDAQGAVISEADSYLPIIDGLSSKMISGTNDLNKKDIKKVKKVSVEVND